MEIENDQHLHHFRKLSACLNSLPARLDQDHRYLLLQLKELRSPLRRLQAVSLRQKVTGWKISENLKYHNALGSVVLSKPASKPSKGCEVAATAVAAKLDRWDWTTAYVPLTVSKGTARQQFDVLTVTHIDKTFSTTPQQPNNIMELTVWRRTNPHCVGGPWRTVGCWRTQQQLQNIDLRTLITRNEATHYNNKTESDSLRLLVATLHVAVERSSTGGTVESGAGTLPPREGLVRGCHCMSACAHVNDAVSFSSQRIQNAAEHAAQYLLQ